MLTFFTPREARELQNLPIQMRLGHCSAEIFDLDNIVSQMKELLVQAREKSNRTLEKLFKSEEVETEGRTRREPVDSAGYRVVLGKPVPVRRELQATLTAKISVVRQKTTSRRKSPRKGEPFKSATSAPPAASPLDWQRPQGQRR